MNRSDKNYPLIKLKTCSINADLINFAADVKVSAATRLIHF